jgi:DNA primase
LDSLLASGLAVRVAVIPPPHDPDSLVKEQGGDAFKQLIERAEGFFDYYLNRLCATNEVTTDKGRLVILRSMAEAVHKTGNVVLIDKYAQKTALRLGVSPDAVRAEFKKLARAATKPIGDSTTKIDEEENEEMSRPQPPSTHEYWLLKLVLLHDDLVERVALHLDPEWLVHPLIRELISRRFAAQTAKRWISLAAFLSECEAPEMQSLITEATIQERPLPNPAQQLDDVLLRLRNQSIDRKLAALLQRASQPEIDELEKENCLREQQELRLRKRQPLG